jgi:hypothetical protein
MHFFYKFLRISIIFRCSRAALDPLGGRMRPAGRVFETAALDRPVSKQREVFLIFMHFAGVSKNPLKGHIRYI